MAIGGVGVKKDGGMKESYYTILYYTILYYTILYYTYK